MQAGGGREAGRGREAGMEGGKAFLRIMPGDPHSNVQHATIQFHMDELGFCCVIRNHRHPTPGNTSESTELEDIKQLTHSSHLDALYGAYGHEYTFFTNCVCAMCMVCGVVICVCMWYVCARPMCVPVCY